MFPMDHTLRGKLAVIGFIFLDRHQIILKHGVVVVGGGVVVGVKGLREKI